MRRKGSKLHWDAILAKFQMSETTLYQPKCGERIILNNVDGSEKVQPLWKGWSLNITIAPLFDPEIWLLKNFQDSHSWTWLYRPVLHYSNGKRLETTTTKNLSVSDSSSLPRYPYTGIPCSNLNPPNMEAVETLTWKGLQDIVSEEKSKL